jgi:hypothetical protein
MADTDESKPAPYFAGSIRKAPRPTKEQALLIIGAWILTLVALPVCFGLPAANDGLPYVY